MLQLNVWVVVDENGDYTLAKEQGSDDVVGEVDATLATRQISVVIHVPEPAAVVVVATLPEESGAVDVVVK